MPHSADTSSTPAARDPFPGPRELGRGVVVTEGALPPEGFPDAPRVRIDAGTLDDPAATVEALHDRWVTRQPVVIELAAGNDALRAPERTGVAPYTLDPSFSFLRERLHFLTWANTYDARRGEPIWWHGRLAHRAGAERGRTADLRLADGTEAWADGGPREPLAVPTVHRESIQLGRLTPTRHRDPDAPLAPDQLAAVTHARGAARIIAPAGSGKTRVLTARLRHLFEDRGVEPELVTAVAYNNRAAAEMRDRLAGVDANVRTLHSLGLAICNADRRRRTIEEREVRDLLGKLVSVPRVLNQDPMAPYLEALGEVRLGLRDPVEVEAGRDDVPGFAEAFEEYRGELDRRDLLDFDEQIYRAIELLLREPELRRRVQRSATHLLVDEFQDLTPAFLLLLRLIAAPSFQVFGVGDDDQTIYGHAGATPDFLIGYGEAFPGAGEHALEINYRCPPAVVEAADTLLSWNLRRVPKRIVAAPGRSGDAGTLLVEPLEPAALAHRALEHVEAWREAGGALTDMAVLARVNASLLPLQVACAHAGIPTNAPLGPHVLQRTGVRAALAWLRVGLDPERLRAADLAEVLRRPSRKLPRAVFNELRRRRTWTLGALRSLASQADGRAGDRLDEFCDDVEHLTAEVTAKPETGHVLRVIRRDVGLGEVVALLDGSRGRADGSSHADDLDALEQVAALHPDPIDFDVWLADSLRVTSDQPGLTLSSIHRVKGREWDRVIVFAANAGLLPHRLAEDVEEERRVFHVALTRCREQVVVLANRDQPSIFLDELTRRADPEQLAARRQAEQARLAAVEATAAEDDAATEEVFEVLRRWRLDTAREADVPAFVVFSDEHLRGIAVRRPADERELALCPGVGPVKLERYGDEVLAVIAALESGEPAGEPA